MILRMTLPVLALLPLLDSFERALGITVLVFVCVWINRFMFVWAQKVLNEAHRLFVMLLVTATCLGAIELWVSTSIARWRVVFTPYGLSLVFISASLLSYLTVLSAMTWRDRWRAWFMTGSIILGLGLCYDCIPFMLRFYPGPFWVIGMILFGHGCLRRKEVKL